MQVASELTRLAKEGDAIVVRNTQPGITIFSDEQLKLTTEWGPNGDPNGNHIREVSAAYLRNPEFRQNILRGIFVIEDAPEILQEALDAQKAEWDSRQQTKIDSAKTLQHMADRTIGRGLTCIAPRGRTLCGSITLKMGNDPEEHAPLCPEHSHMVNEFAREETGSFGADGKPVTVWRRRSRAPRADQVPAT